MTKQKRIEELEQELERLKRDYDNLLCGAYWLEHGSRNRAYVVSITEWEQTCGHGIGSVVCTDLKTAKLVEAGLKHIFMDAKITVSTKQNIHSDTDPMWKTV